MTPLIDSRPSGTYVPGLAYLNALEQMHDNPGQMKVINARGHCAVLAGPGSGKTRCLTAKTAQLLAEEISPPRGIACITFNSECARELDRRFQKLGVQPTHGLFVGTVHAFCFRHLVIPFARLSGIDLREPIVPAPTGEQNQRLRAAAATVFGNRIPKDIATRVRQVRREAAATSMPIATAHGTSPTNALTSIDDTRALAVADAYVRSLRADGYLDFDDMTLIGLQLVAKYEWVRKALVAKFPVLVIDEYQDLGPLLHRMVVTLLETTDVQLLAVGDPDQSIYGFDGADPGLLLSVAQRADVEDIRLPFNYRCGQTIVNASEAALGETRGYIAKQAHLGTVDEHQCSGGLGDQANRICQTIIPDILSRSSAAGVARRLGNIAVLYLDKHDGNVMAAAASTHRIPFQRVDKGSPYQRSPLTRWLEDCAAWCAGGWTRCNPQLASILYAWRRYAPTRYNEEELQERDNAFVRYLGTQRCTTSGAETVPFQSWLAGFRTACLRVAFREPHLIHERQELLDLWALTEAAGALFGMSLREFAGQRGSSEHLNLFTLHSAKGQEFDAVIILGTDQGRMPSWRDRTVGEISEARRRFYVGLTRARYEVHLAFSGFTEDRYGRHHNDGPSQFLIEVRDRLRHEERD